MGNEAVYLGDKALVSARTCVPSVSALLSKEVIGDNAQESQRPVSSINTVA